MVKLKGEKKRMADDLQLYIPNQEDGWFYIQMMSDPETMAYNAPWFPARMDVFRNQNPSG